jgi:hypothetical protein
MTDVLILDFIDKRVFVRSPDGTVRSVTEPLVMTGTGVPPSKRTGE